MKHFFISLALLPVFFFSYISVYAIEAPTNLRATEVWSQSFTLSWDRVTGAVGYYHYIGTSSKNYKDGIDLIEWTQKKIENIDPTKKYYISVTSVDAEGTESKYSQEFIFNSNNLTSSWSEDVFRISEAKILNKSTLELEFTKDISVSVDSEKLFRLEQKSNGKQYPIVLSEVSKDNAKKLIVVLDEELVVDTKYELTVLNIESATGETIESWIDAFLAFNTPTSFSSSKEDSSINDKEFPSAGSQESEKKEEVSVWKKDTDKDNTKTSTSKLQKVDISWMGGKTISIPTSQSSLQKVTSENESLPQTGPREWMLVIVALMLWAFGVFLFKNKEKSQY